MQANRNLWNELRNHYRLADFVVDALAAAGARHVFAMPAESLNPLVDAIRKSDRLRLVTVRHEGLGALMASAEAKLTGRLGVCMGTTGPGATHLVLGAADAREDHAPVVFLTGQVPIHQVGTGGFQEVDNVKLFEGAVAFNRLVASPRQCAVVPLAIAHALDARTGVHLAFPSDVLTDRVAEHAGAEIAAATSAVEPARADRAARHLAGARRPAIVVGAVGRDTGAALGELAGRWRAPLFVLPEGVAVLAAVARHGPLRVTGDEAVAALLDRADAVVLVGAMSPALRRAAAGKPVVLHVAPSRARAGSLDTAAVRVSGELPDVIAQLAARIEAAGDADWLADYDRVVAREPSVPPAWQAVDRALAHDAVVAIEPGLARDAFAYLPVRQRLVTSSFGAATPGYGLAAAIAAALAFPGRSVAALTDRLGLAVAMPELLTARKYDLPVHAICFADGAPVDIARLATSLGTTVARLDGAPPPPVTDAPAASPPGPVLWIAPDPPRQPGPAPTAPSPRCAAIAALLADSGVSHVFAAPSPRLMPLVTAIAAEPRLRLVAVEQPESVAMMASAHAKWTGRPAVCCVDEAHVALQLNGLYDAAFDGAPVVVLTTGAASEAVRLLADAASSQAIATGDGLAATLTGALAEAGRQRGVCHVALADDALTGDAFARVAPGAWSATPEAIAPDAAAIDAAAELLASASRPVLLVGRGAIGAAADIDRLATMLPAAVVSTMPGRAALPWSHPHHAGGIGASGHGSAIDAVAACDVLVSLGSSNRGAVFGLVGDFTQIQVDRDPRQMGRRKQRTLSVVGDVGLTLPALIAALDRLRRNGAHAPARRQFVDHYRRAFEAWQTGSARRIQLVPRRLIHPAAICRALDAVLTARRQRAIVTVDIGVTTLWAYRHFYGDHDIVWSSSFATMGIAVPSALALRAAEPARPVIALVGDGGIAVTMAELVSAARLDLPIIAIVFNNGKLAAIKYEQEVMGWPEYESRLVNCDFAELARACGLHGERVDRAAMLGPVLASALASGRPCVIDVICDPHAMPSPPRIHPWQAAGYALALSREARRFAGGFMRRHLRRMLDGNPT
jgi:thiamine pyrophosphate-dependent acetolactate synthase large subunit-like protein